jgi:hypothetical protein
MFVPADEVFWRQRYAFTLHFQNILRKLVFEVVADLGSKLELLCSE